jgi:hypothetical protein
VSPSDMFKLERTAKPTKDCEASTRPTVWDRRVFSDRCIRKQMTQTLFAEDDNVVKGSHAGWIRCPYPRVHFAKAITMRSGGPVYPDCELQMKVLPWARSRMIAWCFTPAAGIG